jgi:hypothetical protein
MCTVTAVYSSALCNITVLLAAIRDRNASVLLYPRASAIQSRSRKLFSCALPALAAFRRDQNRASRLSTKIVMTLVPTLCDHSFLDLNNASEKPNLSSLCNSSYRSILSEWISRISFLDIPWDARLGVRCIRNGFVIILKCVVFIGSGEGTRTIVIFHDSTPFNIQSFSTFTSF